MVFETIRLNENTKGVSVVKSEERLHRFILEVLGRYKFGEMG